MRIAAVFVLGIFVCSLGLARHIEIEEDLAEARSFKKSEPLVNDCIKAFETWARFKVDPETERQLDVFGLLALQGLIDGNAYEIRSSVHTLGSYEMWKDAARSPRFLIVLDRLIKAAEADKMNSLLPYNIDIKNAYERFLNHQLVLQKEDPFFDKSLACQAIDNAADYFYRYEAFGLFDLFSSYDDAFRCTTLVTELNGNFISGTAEDFRKAK